MTNKVHKNNQQYAEFSYTFHVIACQKSYLCSRNIQNEPKTEAKLTYVQNSILMFYSEQILPYLFDLFIQ